MKFLNPKTDFAFKKIFGSENSTDILLSFLNALLGLKAPYRIREVTILDPYLAPKIRGMKDTYLDVRVKDESGKNYIIEMQVLNVAGFEKRVLYNACKAYAGQINRGEDYQLLTDVIAITITDFVMFPEADAVLNKFKLRAEDGGVYTDDLELIFVELPKFTKSDTTLDSILEQWFYFLKHAEDLEAVPSSLKTASPIVHAFELARKSALTRDELEDQERREIYIQDQRGAIQLAERRGRNEGREEGREKMILQAYRSGMSTENIASMFELALSDVEKIASKEDN